MKKSLNSVSPILQKCARLPSDDKLIAKLAKYGIVFQEEEEVETISTMIKIPQTFFNRHVVEVARDLIGKTLNFGGFSGMITETEAYGGPDDEASHAFRGPTPR